MLMTVEPLPSPGQTVAVLDAIAAGGMDDQLSALAREVAAAGQHEVLIRWAHEMDLANLYPWSAEDPSAYRTAFRRVVSIFRDEGATNARWVWSPSGNTAATEYYPGDDVVDYVGMTVLGDEHWDQLLAGEPARSFAQLLAPKYPALRGYGKPIIIAELGVSGTPEHQREWLGEAARILPEFPLIRAVVYYNAVNVVNNHMPTEPDWRISAAQFSEFNDRLLAIDNGELKPGARQARTLTRAGAAQRGKVLAARVERGHGYAAATAAGEDHASQVVDVLF
jgi:endoglucanase